MENRRLYTAGAHSERRWAFYRSGVLPAPPKPWHGAAERSRKLRISGPRPRAHLPQVAVHAGAHYVAVKEVKAGRTLTDICLLDRAARVTELARMLGGQTQAARRHAEALLAEKAE